MEYMLLDILCHKYETCIKFPRSPAKKSQCAITQRKGTKSSLNIHVDENHCKQKHKLIHVTYSESNF